MEKSEKKKTFSARIYDPHRKLLTEVYGSIQKALDHFIAEVEKRTKKKGKE